MFYDDIELVRDTEMWNWTNCPEIKKLVAENPNRLPPIWQPCATELNQRMQFIKHEPESEQEKHWPGICRGLDEQVYVPMLHEAVAGFGDPSILYNRAYARIPNWHAGELRLYLTTECAEHVAYAPYPEPPDLDCANYEYREDAEEDAWTYWYADDLSDVVDHEYSLEWGTTTEIVCGYLPSRR